MEAEIGAPSHLVVWFCVGQNDSNLGSSPWKGYWTCLNPHQSRYSVDDGITPTSKGPNFFQWQKPAQIGQIADPQCQYITTLTKMCFFVEFICVTGTSQTWIFWPESVPSQTCNQGGTSFNKYCWWKKSCTTWHAWSPANNGIFTISTGWLGFLPVTVFYPAYYLGIIPCTLE